MNIKKSLVLLSIISVNAGASMIKYEMDDSILKTPHVNTGLFEINVNLVEPNEYMYALVGRRSDIEGYKRDGLVVKDSCKKTSSGHLLSLSSARYRCIKKEFTDARQEYQNFNAQFRDSRVQLELSGFTKSYGKVFGETTFKSAISVLDDQEYLVQFDIQKCLDQYGSWWNKNADLSQGQTKVEQYIQALFNETLQSYVRCDLRLSTITNKSGGQSGRSFSPADVYFNNFLIIEEGKSEAHVKGHSFYGSGLPVSYNEVSKMAPGDTYDEERLNLAIEDYGNFMKFEYGLILSEISMKELSTAESQLKVQRFLGQNRAKIMGMLKEIDQAMEPAPFFKKISAGFYISSVYGHISKIEESLKTVLTLDHIIRARR